MIFIFRSKNKNISAGWDRFYLFVSNVFFLPSARGVLAEGAKFFLISPDFDARQVTELSPSRQDKVKVRQQSSDPLIFGSDREFQFLQSIRQQEQEVHRSGQETPSLLHQEIQTHDKGQGRANDLRRTNS